MENQNEKMYDLELSKQVYEHYIENNIGYSDICKKCKSYNALRGRILKNGPIPLFHVGDLYKKSKKRVLFLGTVAYGWEELKDTWFEIDKEARFKNTESIINDIENWILHLFNERKMKFFSYILDSVKSEALFGNDGLRKIALSNLIKCNMGNDKIRNEHLQKNYDFCIRDEYTGNLISDINILDPTHIIILSRDTNKFWRYGKIFLDQGRKVRFVHHPSSSTKGGKSKFIDDVTNFINGTDNN